MNAKVLVGALGSYLYRALIGRIPCHWIRERYLRFYLGRYGSGSSVQLGCSFLNGPRVALGKRDAGDLYSGYSVSVIGIPYDIYERGISDFENGPPRTGAHAAGPAGGFARRL